MNFNKLVFEKLEPLMNNNNLFIEEQWENYIRFGSKKLVVIIVYNPLEQSNTIWIGRKNYDKIELTDTVLKDVFKSNLKINNVSKEVFVNNLYKFFESEGKLLLEENPTALEALEKYDDSRSMIYTADLIMKQNLEAVDKAWSDKNYKDFVKYIEQIDRKKLPSSYELKYKIAYRKCMNL